MARPSTGSNLSIPELEQILEDRRRKVSKLLKRREGIQRKLDSIDHDIAKLGGSVDTSRHAGQRVRNERSLPEVIEDVMRKAGKPMKVGDITAGAQAAGYRTKSDSFRAIVNQTLIKERKRFSPAGARGVYQLKK